MFNRSASFLPGSGHNLCGVNEVVRRHAGWAHWAWRHAGMPIQIVSEVRLLLASVAVAVHLTSQIRSYYILVCPGHWVRALGLWLCATNL